MYFLCKGGGRLVILCGVGVGCMVWLFGYVLVSCCCSCFVVVFWVFGRFVLLG